MTFAEEGNYRGRLRRIGDRALAAGVRAAINGYIGNYGKVSRLDLDTGCKSIEMELMLMGESEPLRVRVERYELKREGEREFLRLYGIRTSRIWLDRVVAEYLEGRSFNLPDKYARIVRMTF